MKFLVKKSAEFSVANKNLLYSGGLALFWVAFLWGFLEKGIYAFGINRAFFQIGILYFLHLIYDKKFLTIQNFVWTAPLFLIAISSALFENPFIKMVNFFLWPVLTGIIFHYIRCKGSEKRSWNFLFVLNLFGQIFTFMEKIAEAFSEIFKTFSDNQKKVSGTVSKVALGLVIFFIMATVFIIPLLGSADAVFMEKMELFLEWIWDFISIEYVFRLIFSLLLL